MQPNTVAAVVYLSFIAAILAAFALWRVFRVDRAISDLEDSSAGSIDDLRDCLNNLRAEVHTLSAKLRNLQEPERDSDPRPGACISPEEARHLESLGAIHRLTSEVDQLKSEISSLYRSIEADSAGRQRGYSNLVERLDALKTQIDAQAFKMPVLHRVPPPTGSSFCAGKQADPRSIVDNVPLDPTTGVAHGTPICGVAN